MNILITINTLIFMLLALLHFYWVFGKRQVAEAVLPMRENGTFLFRPGIISTLIVAFILLGFAFITFGNFGVFENIMPIKYIRFGTLGISAIFATRAVGDFKFVGFFKSIKKTTFAKRDTALYSPLALLISLISLMINRSSF